MASVRTLVVIGALLGTALAVGAVESRRLASNPDQESPREGVRRSEARGGEAIQSDSTLATRFLAGIRGTGPLACEMAIRSLGVGWGWRGAGHAPDVSERDRELLVWGTRRPAEEAVGPLRAGLESPDGCVRRMAARLLGRIRHERATRALLDALSAPNPQTRRLAAIGLGYAEDRSTLDPLLAALEDDEAAVRAASAWALGELEDEGAVPALSRLVAGDPDPGVRRAAAVAIGSLY